MISTQKFQAALLLNKVLRSNRFSVADNQDLSEEKAEDILSFCSVSLLQLCMQQLVEEEDYEHCALLRELILEKKELDYSTAWEVC